MLLTPGAAGRRWSGRRRRTGTVMVPRRLLLSVITTGRCNFNCSYCYYPRGGWADMRPQVAAATLGFARSALGDYDRVEISFIGREPLMRFDIIETFVTAAAGLAPGVSFSLVTNGSLLDRQRLAFLAGHGFRLAVSLDGDAASHDAGRRDHRGRPTHERLAALVPLILEHLPETHVRMTVTPVTAASLPRAADYVFSLGFRRLSISPDLTAAWSEPALASLATAVAALADDYASWLLAGREVAIPAFDSIAKDRSLPALGLFCGAGDSLLCVDTHGDIYPCWRYAGERRRKLGDVFNGLQDARRSFFTTVDQRKLYDRCRDYPYNSICGRCLWSSKRVCGLLSEVVPAQCVFSRAIIDADRRLAEKLLTARCGIFVKRSAARGLKVIAESNGFVTLRRANGGLFRLPISALKRFEIKGGKRLNA